ncbi:rRNA maturation RNase YbeY [Candidatus Peregrinibacteria bacterium]|nr:rRNA maturation RNase YbeY [Candidatus Peregrinibacteria bacterium]MBT4631839.1 rRNA maturation RNase YbeY [Candidatus Peregrinibacteria bacterium]MBT5516343.1 rRNA maturation RNase YbeY [Candidatus Peregrinibacteria bacterium]
MKLIYLSKADTIEQSIFEEILKRLPELKENISGTTVELLITNNDEIQTLNAKYRQKDYPTDVLSFPFSDGDSIGQIVISVDKAKEQAKELGQSQEEELQFLFAHGLLHLLGYDHEDPEDEKIMLAKAYKLLNRKNNG